MLNLPAAVAVDANGNVYIADTDNHRIREIRGAAIATVAGDGEQFYSGDGGPATAAGLDSPNGVAVDAVFNIYIGDTHNQRVRWSPIPPASSPRWPARASRDSPRMALRRRRLWRVRAALPWIRPATSKWPTATTTASAPSAAAA
jgi:hypothetical protein